MNKYQTTVKKHGVEIKFETALNKQNVLCFVYIQFDTKECDLLCAILKKYVYEKVLSCGLNTNNHIHSAIYGCNGIVLSVPENKVTNNIALLYKYIAKTSLTTAQKKECGSGSFSKLEKDLKSFNVYVSGKCKNLIQALKNTAPKIENMMETISNIEFKKQEDFEYPKPEEVTYEIDENDDIAMMGISISMGNIPCYIHKSGSKIQIKLCESSDRDRMNSFMSMSRLNNYRIKNFISQSGNIGTPSKNDKDKSKFNEKVKRIEDSQELLIKIFSEIRGFKVSSKTVKDFTPS